MRNSLLFYEAKDSILNFTNPGIEALHNSAFLFPVARKRGYMDVSFSRWRRRKAKENSVLTLAVQTEYMMQMVIGQVSPFSVFLVEKKIDEFGKIGCPERQGRTDL